MDPLPAIVASLIGLAVLLAAFWQRGGDGRAIVGVLLAVVSAPLALVAGHLLNGSSIDVPPKVFMDWALYASAASMVVGLLVAGGPVLRVAGMLLGGVLAVYVFTVGTESLHERYWDDRVMLHAGTLASITVVALAVRVVQGVGESARERTAEGMLAFALAALAAAPTLGYTGSGHSALLAAGLAGGAGLFGLFLASRREADGVRTIGRAAGAVQVVALAVVIANGVLYGSTPRWMGAVLMLGPILTLLPGRALKASVARLVLVGLAVGSAPGVIGYEAMNKAEPDKSDPASLYR